MTSAQRKSTYDYENIRAVDFHQRANEAKSSSHKNHQSLIDRLSKISQETDAVLNRLQDEELKRNGDESRD